MMNSDPEISYALRWVFRDCFGLVIACLLAPLVGAYVTGHMLEYLSVILKFWFVGAGIALSWGWYKGAKILMSLDSDGNTSEREEEYHRCAP